VINLEEHLTKLTEETIERTIKDGLTTNNLEIVYKLADIYKDMKEVKNMNYGNYYGRRPGYDTYGRDNYGEGNYGRRGYDMKYRGHEYIDRVGNEYGRYMESRERYGAGQETEKSFEYMVKSLEDFIRHIQDEAQTPQQHQMLNETLQRSMR